MLSVDSNLSSRVHRISYPRSGEAGGKLGRSKRHRTAALLVASVLCMAGVIDPTQGFAQQALISAEVEQASHDFRRLRDDGDARAAVAKVLYPQLRKGMSRTEVLMLLGTPDRYPPREMFSRIEHYLCGDGRRIDIEFDQYRERVTSVRAVGLGIDDEPKPFEPVPVKQQAWLADYKVTAKSEPLGPAVSANPTVIRAGFIPHKSVLVDGESLTVTMTITNIGDSDYWFSFGGDYRGSGRHDRIKVVITDVDGNELIDPRAGAPDMGGILGVEAVIPHGAPYTHLIELPQYRMIPGPGTYMVTCSFGLQESLREQAPDVIQSTFPLTILARTPERVSQVLDEQQQSVIDADDEQLGTLFIDMARFGRDEAIERLAAFARGGTLPQRVAALSALSEVGTEPALNVAIEYLSDDIPAVRIAAATVIGRMTQARGVAALLEALMDQNLEVRSALLVALGATRSREALAVLRDGLMVDSPELQTAAVQALVAFGGPDAADILRQHVESPDYALRFQVVDALVSKLRQPLQTEWLVPILMCRCHNHQGWLSSLDLVRVWGGVDAVPILLSCVDFEIPWSHRNFWILHHVKYAKGAPEFDYIYDPNEVGSPEAHTQNRQTLQRLRALAGPIPEHTFWPEKPVTELMTDPPIDFTVKLSLAEGPGEQPATVECGFFKETWQRGGGSVSLQPSPEYRDIYKSDDDVRALLKTPESRAASELSDAQLEALAALPFPPHMPEIEEGLSLLYIWWVESPEGPIRERAKAHLANNVRAAVQKFHQDHVDFAAAAERIMTSR